LPSSVVFIADSLPFDCKIGSEIVEKNCKIKKKFIYFETINNLFFIFKKINRANLLNNFTFTTNRMGF
jgi:hypothetical protein